MLSPSSQSQNLSDEDNSGSDSRSDVELKPETDRFGFIVTNRTTAGCVGPPPELVRQREAKWINIMVQWDRMLLKNTSKVKVQCQKGIPASLRAKCWPLLCGASDRMEQNKNLYQSLDVQPALQSWVDVIERDLDRQFPFHEMFLSKDGHGQRGLFRVLKAYTQHQPEEGYCQAQGPVAAVLLMNMPAEEAFWCLVQISEQYLPGYYSPLLEGVLFDAAMLTWVLKRACPAVHRHLQYYGVEPLMFATDWLMCLFTRHLPFNTLLRVWDLFFCYGVRVLLQVAVVLVRRVLGRAEQRKKCQGQMETLERLRGVREHVQEEDDTFIAEVCSVPLSARELLKQTEKEIEKWRKDRPSSTFDPRHRCLGFQMVWAMARQKQEDQDRMEREKGNLSVPLNRSASTLSLSLSNHHKKKGGKVKADEWEGGSRVVRHVSMGAKEDCRSWNGGNFKKVLRGVQLEEDVVSEEHEKQIEPKLTEHSEQRELKKMHNIQNVPTEQLEEIVTVKEQTEQVETEIPEMEESQFKETERSKIISEQTEEPTVETVPTKNLTLEKTLQVSGHTIQHKLGEELELGSHSQFLEQQNYKSNSLETEATDKNKETEKQMVESEHSAAAEETPTQIQKYADADTNTELETDKNVQKTQVDIVTDTSATTITETSSDSDIVGEVEAQTIKSLTIETEAQQQQQEVITETDNHSQEDEFKKHHSTEAETDMEKESHIQKMSESDALVQTTEQLEETRATQEEWESERVQSHSEQPTDPKTEAETLIVYLHECNQTKEGTDLVTESETEAEIPASNDIVSETSEALARNSEVECDAVEPEPIQGKDGFLTARSEVDKAQTQAPPCTSPPQEFTSQDEEVNLTTKPDGKTSSEETNTYEEPAPAQPKILAAMYAMEEEERLEPVKENTVGDSSIIITTEPTHSNTDSNQQVQDKDSHISKDQAELGNSSLMQASGRRSSRSSGDFCIRKSSGPRGSTLGRRLSEDLFTVPQKTSQSQPVPNQPEIKHTESRLNPGAVNPIHCHPDLSPAIIMSLSEEATERTETQQEPPNTPKRFGFFGRLKGEPAKKTKAKGTPKMQVPKILIQDFSDVTEMEKPVKEGKEEKLSSKERRRRQREQDRRAKEEERLRKKREKQLEKATERERRKSQTRGGSFQMEREKGGSSDPQPPKTGSQIIRYSASYAYF